MPSGLAAGFAVDPDGTVYVGETAGKSLQRFDPITGAERKRETAEVPLVRRGDDVHPVG